MSSINSIFPDKLARLIGVAHCPAVIDVRTEEEHGADPRFVPGALRRPAAEVSDWAPEFVARSAIVVDANGKGSAEGVAAWLRHAGASSADVLNGGHAAWVKSGGAVVPEGKIPKRDPQGRTVWVTRSRPKVDRIACPWLIRRFVDPQAVFLFVAAAEVSAVAERFGAAAFDIEGAFWSHRGERCTFDTMLDEWDLTIDSLRRLAVIVRGADTARLEIAPEAPGLLAASLGLSRMYSDDLEQLDAGMALYDAFYRWCRDATDEPHNWPATKPGKTA
ncbi:sulfurtransferase/chromate resistance protein [Methylosinus sp. PW1]|uniref:chromate resistance protein ChrB domain-containing protein n=1 Tax=Methylosinus sp. PW1 TaxID=107636 RepID=UPI000567DB71|nr:sulfurtransferase/chromate resistance protein [Methylosinus sp. PW1]